MTRNLSSRGALIVAITTSLGLVLSTMGGLPDPVATQFGAGGAPVSFMSRTGYVAFILGFVTILPIFMVAMVGYLPRLMPGAVNVPHRDYWMAPARRAATIDFLTTQGYWLAALMSAFLGGLHWLTAQANAATPPGLSNAGLKGVTFTFLAALAAWMAALFVRFRRPPGV